MRSVRFDVGKTGNVLMNVTLRLVRATNVAVQNQ